MIGVSTVMGTSLFVVPGTIFLQSLVEIGNLSHQIFMMQGFFQLIPFFPSKHSIFWVFALSFVYVAFLPLLV